MYQLPGSFLLCQILQQLPALPPKGDRCRPLERPAIFASGIPLGPVA